MEVKKNLSLIIGLSIPVLMILFVAGSIYLPGLFAGEPEYSFLYTERNYYCGTQYFAENGKLSSKELVCLESENRYSPPEYNLPFTPKIFFHDIAKNQSQEISFEEGQKFVLSSNPTSPDGFKIECATRASGFFIFFDSGRDCSEQYIKGHGLNKKLNIQLEEDYYYGKEFQFLGWIIEK
ncbi:MAG: hypothetical protein ABIG08_01215 [bacterium]